MSQIVGQHRVTTALIECEDHKGKYLLEVGTGFTVTDVRFTQSVDIERDGLMSGSMGGTISRFDFDTKTRQADL